MSSFKVKSQTIQVLSKAFERFVGCDFTMIPVVLYFWDIRSKVKVE